MIFSVVCNTIDVNDIVEVHKHLMLTFKFTNLLTSFYLVIKVYWVIKYKIHISEQWTMLS